MEIEIIRRLIKQQTPEEQERTIEYIAEKHLERTLQEQPNFQPTFEEKAMLIAHSKEILRKLLLED